MTKQVERLVFQVGKQSKEAAAVVLCKGVPALRRGQGAGRIVDLQLALYVDGPKGGQKFMYKWPNPEKKLPPLVMFSLHEGGKRDVYKRQDSRMCIVPDRTSWHVPGSPVRCLCIRIVRPIARPDAGCAGKSEAAPVSYTHLVPAWDLR